MFTGISSDICAKAWEVVLASISAAANSGITNKLAGTIVVLDPLNGEVLFTAHVDDDNPKWDLYEQIAIAKARTTWETGLNSHDVQQNAPHLYRPGMTKWGGAVIENKLVVAFSGVQAVHDAAIASTMLRWIISICQDEMTKPDGVMAADYNIIGDIPIVRVKRDDYMLQ